MDPSFGGDKKPARARCEQWHALLAQRGLRKDIRALQEKHDLRITGITLASQRHRARNDYEFARQLNGRNTEISNLREKYNIAEEWSGLFWIEVVLSPIYRAPTPPHEKYNPSPYTMTSLKEDGSRDYFRIIIGPSVDIDDPHVIATIKSAQQKARKFYRMEKAPRPEKDVGNPRRKNWLPLLIHRLQTGVSYQQIADDIGLSRKYVELQIRTCEANYCTLAIEIY